MVDETDRKAYLSRAERILQLLGEGEFSCVVPMSGRYVIECKGGPLFEYPMSISLIFEQDGTVGVQHCTYAYRYGGTIEVRDGVTIFDGVSPYYNPNFERMVINRMPITALERLLDETFAYKIKGPHDLDYTSLALKTLNEALSGVEIIYEKYYKR